MRPWQALPPGPQLDILIAEKLGYRIVKQPADPQYSPSGIAIPVDEWYLANPRHGELEYITQVKSFFYPDEREGWITAFAKMMVPLFSRDANSPLPIPEGGCYMAIYVHNGVVRANMINTYTSQYGGWQEARTLAHARALAWLAFMELADG